MPLFSKQKWFCNACGKEQFSAPVNAMGREYRTCSIECHREMNWRSVLSTMGKDYEPQPNSKD